MIIKILFHIARCGQYAQGGKCNNASWIAKPPSVIKKCMHEFQGHIQESNLGGNTNWGRGSGGRLEAPSGSRAKPCWGPRGQIPRKLLGFINTNIHFPCIKLVFCSEFPKSKTPNRLDIFHNINWLFVAIGICFTNCVVKFFQKWMLPNGVLLLLKSILNVWRDIIYGIVNCMKSFFFLQER